MAPKALFPTKFQLLWEKAESLGYSPSLYRRGDIFRAHWNVATNAWGEGSTPYKAMLEAWKSYKRNPLCAGNPDKNKAGDESND